MPKSGQLLLQTRIRCACDNSREHKSGILFLGYSFGLPAIAADVGSLKQEIVEGETGFVFKQGGSSDFAHRIHDYFNSHLSHELESRRAEIKAYANERYSWDSVAAITTSVYSRLRNSNK